MHLDTTFKYTYLLATTLKCMVALLTSVNFYCIILPIPILYSYLNNDNAM